jgi:alpha 1,3-glucosidase
MRHVLSVVLTLALVFTAALGSTVLVPFVEQQLTVRVRSYAGGVLRIQIVPTDNTDFYEVTDVIVAKEEESGLLHNCDASEPSCVIRHPASSSSLRLTRSGAQLDVLYEVNGLPAATATIPVEKDKPAASLTFPRASRLYGIPQHAVDLALKKGLKYQLYNLDVFHYKLDDPGGIYGSIPFLMAYSTKFTTGALFLNSAEAHVLVEEGGATKATWSAEVGLVDVFLFPGSTPSAVQRQHALLTGPTLLPPQFSLGYHQCRWNYRSSSDCLDVDNGFDTHNIPYDVLWLDIEHADSKKYFTWDLHNFPEPEKLINAIAAKGRKMVTIKDPHIKREGGYHVHDEAVKYNYYVKTESGSDYEGHCWPGTSSWVDFYNAKARQWYATLFKLDRYSGATGDLWTWIDMNEPSVFNSHQVTMDRDAVHSSADGRKVKHRYVHNMYGYYHTMAAYEGHLLVSGNPPQTSKRPFILTRSFFSGSQRYAAMWTGDNMAQWDHLQKSLPMLLSLNIANYPFVGADVGGFFFNTEAELMVRWMQAAVFYPFFRGHAHLETKRREPWLFGDDATNHIRAAISLRYSLITYLYTVFFRANRDGEIVIRPLFYEFPHEEGLEEEQSTYMFGPALLVRPITQQAASSYTVNLPGSSVWFDFFTGKKHGGGTPSFPCALSTIPLFLRAGYIVPTKQRLRRSSAAMVLDPLTLYVALNDQKNSQGEVFIDDTESFEYQHGSYVHRVFTFTAGQLTNAEAPRQGKSLFTTAVQVERIVFYGLDALPTSVTAVIAPVAASAGPGVPAQQVVGARVLEFAAGGEPGSLTVHRVNLPAQAEWTISLNY